MHETLIRLDFILSDLSDQIYDVMADRASFEARHFHRVMDALGRQHHQLQRAIRQLEQLAPSPY
jgi:hypothetical protein